MGQVAEFKAEEAASGLQDPVSLLHNPINVRAVADAKRDGVRVQRVGFEGQGLCISFHPRELL